MVFSELAQLACQKCSVVDKPLQDILFNPSQPNKEAGIKGLEHHYLSQLET